MTLLIFAGIIWVAWLLLKDATYRYNLPGWQRRLENEDFTQRPH